LITFIKTHWPKASKELVCEIIFPSKTLKMKKMTKLNWPSGFGRDTPVRLQQNQRQVSGNAHVSSRPGLCQNVKSPVPVEIFNRLLFNRPIFPSEWSKFHLWCFLCVLTQPEPTQQTVNAFIEQEIHWK